MDDKMRNARAVRFHPYIDVDVDKTTNEVRRIDVDFSDTVGTEMWDYDTEMDVEGAFGEDDPLWDAGVAAVDDVIIPALRRALTDAAHRMAATYNDYGPPAVEDRADRTVWRITAADLDENVKRELTEDELARFARGFDNSTVNECIEGLLEQSIPDLYPDDENGEES